MKTKRITQLTEGTTVESIAATSNLQPARRRTPFTTEQFVAIGFVLVLLLFQLTHCQQNQNATAEPTQFAKTNEKFVELFNTTALRSPSEAPTAATTQQPTTKTTTTTTSEPALSEQTIEYNSHCSLKTVTRRSHLSAGGAAGGSSRPTSRTSPNRLSAIATTTIGSSSANQTLTERAFVCSHLDELNNRQLGKSINSPENKLIHLQQLHITNSELQTFVINSTVELICKLFNCSRLTVFNMSSQELPDLHKWLPKLPHLEVLDLSNSSLKSVESILDNQTTNSTYQHKTVLNNLTHLNLNDNEIVNLNFSFLFERMPNLRQVSLINNNISNIYCDEFQRPSLFSQFESISLGGNSMNCDKSHMWFIKYLVDHRTNLKFPDYEKINCSQGNLVEMTWSQRVSVIETLICNSCDCKSLKRTAISVDCHNKSLKVLPDVLPLNTKILNLTSNQIDSLTVPQNSRNWENVTYLHLENNRISSIQPLEINSKLMRNLAALDIRRNKFQEFPSHIFEQFVNLDQVHLSDNPWLCDCESTFAFQEWLQRQYQKVGDKEEIRCGVSGSDENGLKSDSKQQRLSSRVIYRLSKSELCPQGNLKEPYDWLDVVNIVLGVTIVLIIAKLVLDYIYQHRTKRLPHFFKLNL